MVTHQNYFGLIDPFASQSVHVFLIPCAVFSGIVDVWSTEAGREPVHHYQHLQRVQGLALGAEGAIVATASGTQVRVERPTDKGYWETASQCELQKPVSVL